MRALPAVVPAVLVVLGCGAGTDPSPDPEPGPTPDCTGVLPPAGARVLVFTRTQSFRHPSIPDGVAAITAIGERYGIVVEHTESGALFTDGQLARFDAVVFLNTSGDVLNGEQEAAFERFIRGGGGYVGVHAASDTEYGWAWYGGLVGAYFARHPLIQEATVHVADPDHPSTGCLASPWVRTDEWYDFQALPAAGVTTLLTVDESTYQGGGMGSPHPVTWAHAYDGGRAWYTGMGHTEESYAEPAFLDHLAGGILWAVTRN